MPFQVLCLSGGGFMGLYSALVLADLERRRGAPIHECFDLISGTSIGGIIGLGLASGVPAAKIVEAFVANGEQIFSDRQAAISPHQLAFDVLRFIRGAKYSPAALEATVQSILGNCTMADLPCRALVPAVDVTHGRPHLFRTPHAPDHSGNIRALDVALATSAAPTVFPMHRIGDTHYVDGGIFAQSPDTLALTEATSVLGVPDDEVSMLSIGTTTEAFDFGTIRSASLGLTDWVENQRVLRMSWAMQQQAVGMQVRARLGDRYLRLDSAKSMEDELHLGLDVACESARQRLTRLAQQRVASITDQEAAAIDRLLAHQPSAQGKVAAE